MGTKCKWSSNEELCYGGRWRLWNVETRDVEYKKRKVGGRSYDQHNIDFSMNNNHKSEGFGMQRFEDDLSRVIFAQSLGVFAQSLDLLAQSIEKLI